jgi:hypothetical protein
MELSSKKASKPKPARRVLGDITGQVASQDATAKKVLTRATRQKLAVTDAFDEENAHNATPSLPAHRKQEAVALSAKRLSTAIELASQASSAARNGEPSGGLHNVVSQLKVVELRDELKRRGVEGKRYSGLRKAALVALVVQVRQSTATTTS